MTTLYRLAGLLLALALLQLSGCGPTRRAAQAPGPARHRYHRAERRNEFHRRHAPALYLPWAGPDRPRIDSLDLATARNWAVRPALFRP